MEYIGICLAFYAVIVFIDLVPGFKNKKKKTVIFTISVMVVGLVISFLNAFDFNLNDPTVYIENAISAIFKV